MYRIFWGFLQNLSNNTSATNVNSIFIKHWNGRRGEFVNKEAMLWIYMVFSPTAVFSCLYRLVQKKTTKKKEPYIFALCKCTFLTNGSLILKSACWPPFFLMWRLCSVALFWSFVAVLMWRFSLGEHCKIGPPHFICHSVMRRPPNKWTAPSFPSLPPPALSDSHQTETSAAKPIQIQCYLLSLISTGNITEPSLTSSSPPDRHSTAFVSFSFSISFACF